MRSLAGLCRQLAVVGLHGRGFLAAQSWTHRTPGAPGAQPRRAACAGERCSARFGPCWPVPRIHRRLTSRGHLPRFADQFGDDGQQRRRCVRVV